jgi:hypothetical protein
VWTVASFNRPILPFHAIAKAETRRRGWTGCFFDEPLVLVVHQGPDRMARNGKTLAQVPKKLLLVLM